MINLLPPQVKDQIAYAKRNMALIRLIVTVAVAAAAATGILDYASLSLNKNLNSAQRELASEQKLLADPKTVNALKDVGQKLTIVGQINTSKHHYSAFLRDLASALPSGSWIGTITLAGDGKPYKLGVNAKSQAVANEVKDSLAKSPRVQSVDLETIAQNGDAFVVSVTVAFKPGQDK